MTAEEARQYGLIDEVLQFEESDKAKKESKKP
jgi:ATP-dependent protease ClpP protease subunit